MFSEFEQEESRLAAVFQRKAQDFDDLQNEIASRDNGRARRFLNGDRHDAMSDRDRDGERAQMLSALQQLLQDDPEYAALSYRHPDGAQLIQNSAKSNKPSEVTRNFRRFVAIKVWPGSQPLPFPFVPHQERRPVLLEQRRADRLRETRVVEQDAEIVAPLVTGGLRLPRCTELGLMWFTT